MKSLRFLFPALFLTLPTLAQSPFFPEEMVVTATSLNLRETPDKNGKKITSLSRGTVVQFVEAHDNGQWVQADANDPNSPYGPWLKIRHQGKTGYAFGIYLSGTIGLYREQEMVHDENPLPPFHWYGVYQRDSFADELRKIEVRVEKTYSEFYGDTIQVLKTNQNMESKFIIGSFQPMKTGYAGPLGIYEVQHFYLSGQLSPGNTTSIHAGYDDKNPNEAAEKPSYTLVATGCASMEANEYFSVRVSDYKLSLLDFTTTPARRQDLTHWVQIASEEAMPTVSLSWYGDLDMDGKPDAILNDCPYEMGCRESIFLSSKAKPGEYLKKVCERFWPMD